MRSSRRRPGRTRIGLTLADALLRQIRVSGNAAWQRKPTRAAPVSSATPERYDARSMLAATYLSQHRFSDALREARRCQAMRADDAWVYGVIGDAHLERGEYDAAFDAFDRMAAIKPTAAAYARVSYARELQGDLPGALRTMQMAAESTSPHDPESLAWHRAQLGQLHLEMGQLADARREFLYAGHVFPGHPFAAAGLARVAAASGDARSALDIVMAMLATTPTPADLALSGDLMAKLGQPEAAERQYRLAEAAWRSDAPEPSRLARFLAEHGRRLDEAIAIGERARIDRNDIFTADALAWAYFQTGQLDKAKAMMALALRTGTRDRIIRAHAAEIRGRRARHHRWRSGDSRRCRVLAIAAALLPNAASVLAHPLATTTVSIRVMEAGFLNLTIAADADGSSRSSRRLPARQSPGFGPPRNVARGSRPCLRR